MDPVLKAVLTSWDWRVDVLLVLALAGTLYTVGWWRLRKRIGPKSTHHRGASPTLFGELTAMFAGHTIGYEPVIEATEYTTVVGLVAAGQGVAVVPACVQTFRPPGVHYLRLNEPTARSRLLLLRREADARPLVGHAARLAATGLESPTEDQLTTLEAEDIPPDAASIDEPPPRRTPTEGNK